MRLAGQVDVVDAARRLIANPDREVISRAAVLAMAYAVEGMWAVSVETDLLLRALALPDTGADGHDAAKDAAVQHQISEVTRLLASMRGPEQEKSDGSSDS